MDETPNAALAEAEIELKRRHLALAEAVRLSEAGQPVEDVLETASEFYAWLHIPGRHLLSKTATWSGYQREKREKQKKKVAAAAAMQAAKLA